MTAELIAENDVTTKTLLALFERAFFMASVDSDGDIVVHADGTIVVVVMNEDKKMLKYVAIYEVKDTAPLELKHAFANKLNNTYMLCRFSIPEGSQDILAADYYLPYGEGITDYQIVSSLRLFARVVPEAIRDCDDSDVVE